MITVVLTPDQYSAVMALIEIEQSLDAESRHLNDYGDDETTWAEDIDGAREALLKAGAAS